MSELSQRLLQGYRAFDEDHWDGRISTAAVISACWPRGKQMSEPQRPTCPCEGDYCTDGSCNWPDGEWLVGAYMMLGEQKLSWLGSGTWVMGQEGYKLVLSQFPDGYVFASVRKGTVWERRHEGLHEWVVQIADLAPHFLPWAVSLEEARLGAEDRVRVWDAARRLNPGYTGEVPAILGDR